MPLLLDHQVYIGHFLPRENMESGKNRVLHSYSRGFDPVMEKIFFDRFKKVVKGNTPKWFLSFMFQLEHYPLSHMVVRSLARSNQRPSGLVDSVSRRKRNVKILFRLPPWFPLVQQIPLTFRLHFMHRPHVCFFMDCCTGYIYHLCCFILVHQAQ